MITEEQYKKAIEDRKKAEDIISQYHQESNERFDERYQEFEKGTKPFTDDELRYAAYNRCPCGHGLAYPKNCRLNHFWDCSAILKGIADTKVQHTGKLPFMFYSIKSEDQPSARGATTRGPVVPQVKKDIS